MDVQNIIQTQLARMQTPLVAITTSVCLVLATTWTIWNNVNVIRHRAVLSTATEAYHPPMSVKLTDLSNYHLMGASPVNLKDLPLASLGVTLIGIFINGGQATALISFDDSTTKTYRAHEQLAPNVIIEKILPTSVVVKHNGRLEKLEMGIQPIDFSNTLPQSSLWNNTHIS
jgi:hypothetical protein